MPIARATKSQIAALLAGESPTVAKARQKRPGKPCVPLEKDIQRQILDYLALRGIPAWRVNSGAMVGEYKGKKRFMRMNGKPGMSDICGVIPGGRALFIEVKRPGRLATVEQTWFLNEMDAAGALAFVAWSVADVEKALGAVQ